MSLRPNVLFDWQFILNLPPQVQKGASEIFRGVPLPVEEELPRDRTIARRPMGGGGRGLLQPCNGHVIERVGSRLYLHHLLYETTLY